MNGDDLAVRIRTRTVKYGDDKKFVEYRILFFKGPRVVGAEDGPPRATADRGSALKAARARVAGLKKQRLFVVRVTGKHIRDGEERSCDTCAIAQALYHNQERMGLDRNHDFRVEPYGWSERGIVLQHDGAPDKVLSKMPAMVSRWQPTQRDPYPESMLEWTMRWDSWAEGRRETVTQYRERTGDEGKDSRPRPTSFVLNLDAFVEERDHG